MVQIAWLTLGIVTFSAALRAGHSLRALRVGRVATGVLYTGAGALVNAVFLATGEDYADFAKGSYIPFVRDTWQSLVVPHHHLFIWALIVYELVVGVLVLSGGRRTEYGLVGAIGFHVALLSFGWGFYLWSVPMLVAFVLLLRAQRRSRPSGDDVGGEGRREGAPSDAPGGPGVYLYWIPLGAGARVVRLSGRIYEAGLAAVQRRPRRRLFHSALIAVTSTGPYVIEMTPIPSTGGERGVAGEGAVGSRWARRLRIFRYEIRCWRDGVIPDIAYAIASPVLVAQGPDTAARIVDLAPFVPTPVWGRDELRTGEMWNSNSVVSWLLARAALSSHAGQPPMAGRAPGWDAGLVAAARASEGSGGRPVAPESAVLR